MSLDPLNQPFDSLRSLKAQSEVEGQHQLCLAKALDAARAVVDQRLPRIHQLRDAILREGYRSSGSSEEFAAKERTVAESRRELARILKEIAGQQVQAAGKAIREALLEGRRGLTADEAELIVELLGRVPDRSNELAEQTAGTLGGTKAAADLLRQGRRGAEASLAQALGAEAAGSAPPSRRGQWRSEFRAKVQSPTHAANFVWGLAGLLIGALLGVLGTLLAQWLSK